jgi:hypothetical protein
MPNRSKQRRVAAVYVCACALVVYGCDAVNNTPSVQYGTVPIVGRWQDQVGAAGSPAAIAPPIAGTGSPAIGTTSGSLVAAGSSGGTGRVGVAGSSALVAGIGGGGVAGRLGASGSGVGAAGKAGSSAIGGAGGSQAGVGGSSPDGGGTVSSVAFDVMTAPQGGLYQPRNIGAIWIQDSSGKFMKSLEVWAGIRRTYLSKYNSAHGSMAIDVTASATLNSHKMHHATWNLKDRSGAAAPPGKYTVFIELTDTDWTGKFKSVDFDTSMGPQTLMPTGDSYFSALKLTLQ